MDPGSVAQFAALAAAGVAAGLWLLARGLGGYRTATRIGDTSTSTIASLAAGEVRLSGVIEPAELSLVSPFQSVPCVYYDATIETADDGPKLRADLHEERAVGFRVRDDSGDVRVFPRGARWDAPVRYDERTGTFGETPAGLSPRIGPSVVDPEPDRATAVAALLSVRPVADPDTHPLLRGTSDLGAGPGRRRFRERRLEPGDAVTIIGRALPFADLADPAEADVALGGDVAADDTEVAADLAEARAAGLLADTPEEAWGNAAIAGFGIGRPVRAPELDPAATSLPIASAEEAVRTQRRFTIAPETLIVASAPGVPLLIAHGIPTAAVDRHQDRFIVGLLGAILAIASAMALAVMISDGIR